MMTTMLWETFESARFGKIRTLVEKGLTGGGGRDRSAGVREWFVAADVCLALGYSSDTSGTVRRHVNKRDTAKRRISDARGHHQSMLVVSESGLYALIFGSVLPEAERFKYYVTAVILPSIRRHGAYMEEAVIDQIKDDPEALKRLFDVLAEEMAKNKQLSAEIEGLENRIRELKPKALFGEAVSASEGSISMGDMAKLLRQNGVMIGRTRLFEKLRKYGFLCRQKGSFNKPLQWTMELGYFEIEEGPFNHPLGAEKQTFWSVTRVTPRGQASLVDLFLAQREEDFQ